MVIASVVIVILVVAVAAAFALIGQPRGISASSATSTGSKSIATSSQSGAGLGSTSTSVHSTATATNWYRTFSLAYGQNWTRAFTFNGTQIFNWKINCWNSQEYTGKTVASISFARANAPYSETAVQCPFTGQNFFSGNVTVTVHDYDSFLNMTVTINIEPPS